MIGFPKQDVQVPTPETTESFERYAIRAHRSLLASDLDDADERNELIERAWTQHNGETDAEREAKRHFSPRQFQIKKNVCVFAEHETEDERGQTRKYSVKDLAKIVRDCNHRIAERGAFPVIADGHTPSDEGKPQPDVLGYHGTYRLGMIGRKEPGWAIFADEYHLKDKAEILRRKPRRSVELWTIKKSGEQFFDPVAALGSEAPRLPLPIKFQTVHSNGAVVEKYSFEAPAAHYEAGLAGDAGGPTMHSTTYLSESDTDEGAELMMADEDLRQLIAAVAQTPEFVWIRQQMQQEQAELDHHGDEFGAEHPHGESDPHAEMGAMDPAADPLAMLGAGDGDYGAEMPGAEMPGGEYGNEYGGQMPGGEYAEAMPGAEYGGEMPGDMDYGSPPQMPGMPGGMKPKAPPPSAKPQLYAPNQAAPPTEDPLADLNDVLGIQPGPPQQQPVPGNGMPYPPTPGKPMADDEQEYGMRYRHSLAYSDSDLARENYALSQRLMQVEQQSADSDRRRRLAELAHRYPGLVDADEESRVCLYSMGANISDGAFNKHLATIEKFALRAAPRMAERIPTGVLPGAPGAKYSGALSHEIRRLSDHYATHGEFRDYDSLVVEAHKNLKR